MKHLYFFITLFLFLSCSKTIYNQPEQIKELSDTYAKASLDQFKELLAIPNDANYPDDIDKNISWCESKFAPFGFTTKRLESPTVPLLLLTHQDQKSNRPTVLFYFHADGQPVDQQYWFQDDPYEATLKKEVEAEGWVTIPWDTLYTGAIDPDWRIFGRSTSDDKGPIAMLLAALQMMQDRKEKLPYNLKVILDFEEEKGSVHLAETVAANKDLLRSDMLLIYDGPKHGSNLPTISHGARGITTISLEVFGPTFPLHSGHYGNYAPNPAMRLSQLLATMKDDNGRVVIPGFYDGITLDEATKSILSEVPDNERELRAKLGIGDIDQVGGNYQESIQYPSLNVRGMSAGWVGSEARTIVPASATAEIDIRLVAENDPAHMVALVRKHVEDQGYYILDRKPTSRERVQHPRICRFTNSRAYRAFRTDFSEPLSQWVYTSLKNEFQINPIRVRTSGGSLPVTPFIRTLNVPAVTVPLVNSDNNQHSPNENLRVGNYFDGVRTLYTLLQTPF